jgi:precorrin-2/cobalt-factor-2 C20-methyltransferase
MTLGKFYGIGIGPGDSRYLTLQAVDALRRVAVIFEAGSEKSGETLSSRALENVEGISARRSPLLFAMSKSREAREQLWRRNAELIADELKRGHDCAFITLGDPLFYSTYLYILRELKNLNPTLEVETVPGITSFQVAAAKRNFPLAANDEAFGVIPAIAEEIPEELLKNLDTVVLLKTYRDKTRLAKILREYGFAGEFLYASKLGFPEECLSASPEEMASLPDEYLSLILARKQKLE